MQHLIKGLIALTALFALQISAVGPVTDNFIIRGTENLVDTEVSSQQFHFGGNWRGPTGSSITLQFQPDEIALNGLGERQERFQFIPEGSSTPVDIIFSSFPLGLEPPFSFVLDDGISPLICSQITKVQPGDFLVITEGTTTCSGQYIYTISLPELERNDSAFSTVLFSGGTPPNLAELNQVTEQSSNTLYGLLGTTFQTRIDSTNTIIINATDLIGEPRGGIQWYFTAEGSSSRVGLPSSLAGVTIETPQDGTSILNIQGITGVHLGEYTAEATNEHGTDSASAFITQGVAPFITEGSGQSDSASFRVGADRAITFGDTVSILAEDQISNPSADIAWSFSRNPLGPYTAVSQNDLDITISGSANAGSGAESTLTISNIQDARLGYYRATATNVHGSHVPASSLVGRSPSIREGSGVAVVGSGDIGSSFNGAIDQTINIVAVDTEGFPSSNFQWQRVDNGGVTNVVSGGRFVITSGQSRSTLTINGVQSGDRGTYRATATNGLTPDDAATSLVGGASTCRSGNAVTAVNNGAVVDSAGYFDTVNANQFSIRARDINGVPHGTVSWSYSRTENGARSSPDSRYTSTNTPANEVGTINFFNLENAALGYYFAEISNQFGNEECANLVGSSLQFASGSGQIGESFEASEGASVTIEARIASGYPQGSITWRGSDGSIITPSTPGYITALGDGVSTLTIQSARTSDFGTYTATTSNVFGSTSATSTVTQSTTILPPTIDAGDENTINTDGSGRIGELFESTVGDVVTITANDIAGREASAIRWFRIPPGGTSFIPVVNDGTYTITSQLNAQGFTDSTLSFPVGSNTFGTYRAEASNSAGNDAALSVVGRGPRIDGELTFPPTIGSGQSRTVNVGAQISISDGGTVSLAATDLEGQPGRTFTWYYRSTTNGPFGPLPTSSNIRQLVNGNIGTLQISNLDRSQYGDYLVQATNQFGESTNVTTRVGGPPIIRVLTGTETDGEGEIGQDFIIPTDRRLRITACWIGGFPDPIPADFEFREDLVVLNSVQQPAPNENCFIFEEGEFEITCQTVITARTENIFGVSNIPESRITFPSPAIVEGSAQCNQGSTTNSAQIGSQICLYNQNSFQLTCSLERSNIPDFTFEWLYQASTISNQQGRYSIVDNIPNGMSTLTVSNVGVSEVGRYTCQVTSVCGQADAASTDIEHFDYEYICDESAGRTICQESRNGAAATSVATSVCDRLGLPAPVPCEGCEWVIGQWSDCSDTTCHRGRRTRSVDCFCNNVVSDDETDCSRLRPKPDSMDRCGPLGIRCNRPFRWNAFPFGRCSANCGPSFRRRVVQCVSTITSNQVSDVECNELFKPPTEIRCDVPPCSQCRDSISEEFCNALIDYLGNCNAYPYYIRMDCCQTCFRRGL